jgi:hypothetical protein
VLEGFNKTKIDINQVEENKKNKINKQQNKNIDIAMLYRNKRETRKDKRLTSI